SAQRLLFGSSATQGRLDAIPEGASVACVETNVVSATDLDRSTPVKGGFPMRGILLRTLAVVILGVTGSLAHARCNDPRVAQVRATINAECQCTGNHGQYVSCVAHHVRDAVRNNEIDTNCKGAVTRCAARSTCGKDGFVTCAICAAGT